MLWCWANFKKFKSILIRLNCCNLSATTSMLCDGGNWLPKLNSIQNCISIKRPAVKITYILPILPTLYYTQSTNTFPKLHFSMPPILQSSYSTIWGWLLQPHPQPPSWNFWFHLLVFHCWQIPILNKVLLNFVKRIGLISPL